MAPEVVSFQFDSVEVLPQAFQVLRDGIALPLEPKAVRVLLYLIENRGRAVGKDELLGAVWGDTAVTDNALTRVIAQLRRELGDDARNPRYIQTVPTLGYRFIAELRSRAEEIAANPVAQPDPSPVPRRDWQWVSAGGGLILLVAAVGWLTTIGRRAPDSAAPPALVTRQLTTSAGFDNSASFSPDGRRLVYSSDRTGRLEIYVRSTEGIAAETQLTNDGGQNLHSAWSPDGKWIAYHSARRGGVWVIPASGGAPRQIVQHGSQPSWSPDGSRIAFRTGDVFSVAANSLVSGERQSLMLVPVHGGRATPLTQEGNPPGQPNFPTWRPDGKRILFVLYTGRTAELWLADPDGRKPPQRLAELDLRVFVHPVFDPSGRSVYFGSYSQVRDFGIWRLPLTANGEQAAAQPVEVVRTGPAIPRELAISADGKRLAYTASSQVSQIWRLPMRGTSPSGDPAPLFRDTVLRTSFPVYSPDATKIAFNARVYGSPGEIYVMNSDGSGAAPLTNNSVHDLLPSWTPDGTAVIFTRDTESGPQWWRASLTDRSEKPLLNATTMFGFGRMSPDGGSIVLHRGIEHPSTIFTVDVTTGVTRQLTADADRTGYPAWSPDGKWIAYELLRGDHTYLALMDRDGRGQHQLQTDAGHSWCSGWSPDSRKILFAGFRDGDWNLWWIDRETKVQRKLTDYSSLATYVRYPAWSPRGDSIVFEHSTTRGNVYVVDLKPGS